MKSYLIAVWTIASLPILVFAQSPKPNDSVRVMTRYNEASAYVYTDTKEALRIARLAIDDAKAVGFKNGVAHGLGFSGFVYAETGDVKNALLLYDEALRYCEANGLVDKEAAVYNNLGNLYERIGASDKAFESLSQSLKIRRAMNDSVGMARMHHNLGKYLNNRGLVNDAQAHFEQSLALYRAAGISEKVAMALNSVAVNRMAQRQYTSALPPLLESLRMVDTLEDQSLRLAIYCNLGLYHHETDNLDSATFYYERALGMYREANNEADLAVTLNNLGELSMDIGDLQAAESHFKESLQHAQAVSSIVDIRFANANLALLYARQSNFKAAYDHQSQAMAARDSLMNEQKAQDLASQTARLAVMEMESQKAVLEKENELQTLKLQRKDAMIFAGAIIGLLLLGGVALWVRQNKWVHKQQRLELEQKQLRAQMNPHFIFNCLNSIQHFVVQNDVRNANKYLTRFASLMRQTLDQSQHGAIPLRDEMQYLEDYIMMEQMRYEHKFTASVVCDDGVDANVEIPPMIIQPFVENAIRHGLCYLQDKPGVLAIRFYKQDRHLVCEINDNGIGRERSQNLKRTNYATHTPHGVDTVAKRLTLVSKQRRTSYTMEVLDKYDEAGLPAGTRVKVKFPLA